jgi:hypothetical protein
MTHDRNRQLVWEAISEFNNVSETESRQICRDLTQDNERIPADEFADLHSAMIHAVNEVMESPDIRAALLGNPEEEEEEVFVTTEKILESKVDNYLKPHNQDYYCTICRLEQTTAEKPGVSLGCIKNNCKSVFCKECISTWITTCCAQCPNCRESVSEIKMNIDSMTHKPKILIRIKKRHNPMDVP